MLLMLVARETLTPLFALAGGAAQLAITLDGTGCQQNTEPCVTEPCVQELAVNCCTRQTLLLDPNVLAHCLRRAGDATWQDTLLTIAHHPMHCRYQQAPVRLPPKFVAWGWVEQIITGFGFVGPQPWFAVGTIAYPQANGGLDEQESFFRFLFEAFVAASQVYAASLHQVLNAPRLQGRMLHHLATNFQVLQVLQAACSHHANGSDAMLLLPGRTV